MREWRKRTGLVGACVAAAAAMASILAPGCNDFNGPYPCNPGYASCSIVGNANGNGNGNGSGNGNDNGCETPISSDPQNCGACAKLCPQGALCTDGKCSAAPLVLATDVSSQEPIALSSSDVFYWTGSSGLKGISKGGGSEFSVFVSGNSGNGGTINPQPFAVDDTSVYYLASVMQSMGGPLSGLLASPTGPWDGGAGPTPRIVATIPQNMSGGQPELLLESGSLFVFLQGSNGPQLDGVPTGGGTIQDLATLTGNPQAPYALDTKNAYFVSLDNGTCAIESAPLAGGMVSTLTTTICPTGLASDGTNVYWATPQSMPGNNGNTSCSIEIQRVPVGGGSVTTFATIMANEAPYAMATDATSVYLLTNASLWSVPITGGTPARLAGNLGGMNAQTSNTGCVYSNGGTNNASSMAVDDTNAYVAVGSTLLAIPK